MRSKTRLTMIRVLFALVSAALIGSGSAPAQDSPLASGQLLIQGNRLTLFANELTTDADQTVNVGEQAQVRTCFGGPSVPCGSVRPGDPRIAGLIVQAELSGPELPQPLALQTVPGGAFILPGFQQEGDYRLENIRMVNQATGQVLGNAEPSVAVLHVRQIVLASASVKALSLEELRERGISITEKNFQAFNFAVGFALQDEIVQIEFPVVYSGNGILNPIRRPKVMLDKLPPETAEIVQRWKPPRIVPFRLEKKKGEERDLLVAGTEGDEELSFPLFGAIVIPGTVTFLNQFFEAKLIVANGGDVGSGVTLENLSGALRLPTGNALRLAETNPPVIPGQEVPVVKPGGGRILQPGQQGTADWTVEGLFPGTHTLQMDITGDLVRPGREPFPVQSRVQAAVEVVDARFNLTFSHPDVVREGIEYTLFVTVSNMSQATQNLITVELRAENITGAHRADPNDDFKRRIETLAPGQSVTVEYELIADLNGQVIATTFQADSTAATGIIRLRAGVGPLGIPLSPATLLMPQFTDQLDPPNSATKELVKSHVRVLGLGYSLAVAPSGRIPPGVPRVVRSDVERRAIDLAEAGQRIFLSEQMLETLEVLALDWLGNREHLDEFDELRRRVNQGLRASSQIAAQIRLEQASRGLGALELFDHFGETVSYARPWMAATLIPGASTADLELEVHRMTERGPGILARVSDDEDAAQRTLPYGEVYAVNKTATGGPIVPFVLVGHVQPAEVFQVVVENPTAQPASARLVLMVPEADTGDYRRLDFGTLTVPASGSVAVDAGAGVPGASSGGYRLYDFGSGSETGQTATESQVPLPPFRVIGSRQHFRIAEVGPDPLGNWHRPNRYGSGLTYLFNRPADKEAGEDPDNYAILSSFDGLDAIDEPASGVALKTGEAAFRQENSERVVNVRFSGSIAALIRADGTGPLVIHEQQLDAVGLVDERGNPLDPNVPAPILETVPLHVGGLVDGVVRHGTGDPAPGTKVELIRPRFVQTLIGTKTMLDLAGTTTADENGRFFFEYIENPTFWDHQVGRGFTLRATVPEGDDPELEPAQVQEVSSVIRRQNRLAHVNVQLLGRGTITGRLVYLDTQQPVPEGKVIAASTLFREVKTIIVEADGTFRIPSLPVGPITLTGRDEDGRSVYATVGINEPGTTVADVHLEIQRFSAPEGMGTITGRVLRRRDGVEEAAEGARIACYSDGRIVEESTTLEDGSFLFDDVPEGRVSLQAADWRISRTPVVTDLVLGDGETVNVDLVLLESDTRTVKGKVYFDDPIASALVPVEGVVAFIPGPGNYGYTDENGEYTIEGVPVQGVGDRSYSVTVIDNDLQAEESVNLPQILDVSPEVILAETIVFSTGIWEGGVDGVVLDPLGRPMGGAELVLFPFEEKRSNPDGTFSFDNIPVGDYRVTAHVGDGLQAGRVGYIGDTEARVIYGGHRPFVTIRMRGSGILNVKTRTASSVGVLTPLFYKPTYYSSTTLSIILRGSFFETSTTELGDFSVELPVGQYELVAFNPFHGIKEIKGEIEYPGQVVNLDILFEDAGTVQGQVVDVDGTTPVPDIEVTMATKTLKPQTQRTDAQGNFRFELVPQGGVAVTAAGLVGTVERVGRTVSSISLGGQVAELVVQMKQQGSIRGRVMENFNGELRPIVNAQYFVQENSYPFRRLPEDGTFFIADAEGRYQVSHIFAGRVNVVARDPLQVTRTGSGNTTITADWQVAQVPDIVMKTSVGSLFVVVRDPQTGGPVADAQVRLSNAEVNSSDSQGVALYEALALGTYSVYAFNAATGQSGRVGGVVLSSPGQRASITVFLDQRGEVLGTLYDDPSLTAPIAGGTVQLSGQTAGGRLTALATTSGREESLGRFAFLGIPEGLFNLTGAVNDSNRRTSTTVELTETAPVADINLVLEPVGDVHVRLFEKLTAGSFPVDLDVGIFSIQATQPSSGGRGLGYAFTQTIPLPASDVYFFPDVLLERRLTLGVQELGGEQRTQGTTLRDLEDNVGNPVPGTGSFADPYQVTLNPKGAVEVTVRRENGTPAVGVNVKLGGAGTVTDSQGKASYFAVRAGGVFASAVDLATGQGGSAGGRLDFDDQVVPLEITLSAAVSAEGIIYLPVHEDRFVDASQLVPMEGAIVELRDSKGQTRVELTGPDGTYRFDALPKGGYLLKAQNNNGDQKASIGGSLEGPDGNVNQLPPLVLDASPPRILSLVPPPGIEGVSLLAPVEIVFSEPLHPGVLPSGGGNQFFQLVDSSGSNAIGTWESFLDPAGFQVVRFVPSVEYLNFTVYSLTIQGGTGGVRDLVDRPVVESGNVGSNFKTSDVAGPAVIGTVPNLDVPVDPLTSIRVDFNEAVVATTEQLDGDGIGDAAELYGERLDDGGNPVWVPLVVSTFLTRSGYSLQVVPDLSLALDGDTLRRRLVVAGLVDAFGNAMPAFEQVYRLFDANAPVLDEVRFPDNAPTGDLIQGVTYVITPVISNVDDVTPENPGGDVELVEYFFLDPEDPTNPQTPSFSAVEHPFTYSFIGAYSGNGVDPRPFPVWARVVDTSTNESALVMIEMQVLPNAPPVIGAVSSLAHTPVAGTFYAGSDIEAVVTALDDPDGAQLTLSVELRQDGDSFPIASPPGRLVQRPAGGWQDLAPQSFDFDIPIDLPEGSPLYYFARVIDSQGAIAEAESERFPVADDAVAPRIDTMMATDGSGNERLAFFIGDQIIVKFRARDIETAVRSAEVVFDRDDILPSPIVATRVGSTDTFTTAPVPVPADLFTETIPIEITARAFDWGGNTGSQTLSIDVAPEPDPNAPVATWRTPWQSAAWPADYTSIFTPQLGTPFLLRAHVADTTEDDEMNVVPGQIVSVRFRGPVVNEAGDIELASSWSDGVLVAGTDGPGEGVYELLWFMPNQIAAGTELPFAVRAVDSGGSSIVSTVRMSAVASRKVYEGVQTAVAPEDPMLQPEIPAEGIAAGDPTGPVFVLDGSLLSIRPQPAGLVRVLPSLYVYAGGEIDPDGNMIIEPTVLTAPEITSFNSAVLYNPMELEIEGVFAVGAFAGVDMSAKGLLGQTRDDTVVLPDEVGSEIFAGGSHGGRGWFGSASNHWNLPEEDLRQPGSVYDNLRDPKLPGSGGRSTTTPGGAGGGVIRILAPMGMVHLAGDLLANGSYGPSSGGGGAGGAIRVVAGRLEGVGRIEATGGPGRSQNRDGGGGGGRISISYGELATEVDLAAQTDVSGGGQNITDPSRAVRLGGAGTVYLEVLDPATGEATGDGAVLVGNTSGLPAALTPFPALGDGLVDSVDTAQARLVLGVDRVRGDLVGERVVLELETGERLGIFPILSQTRFFDSVAGAFRVELGIEASAAELLAIETHLAAGTPVTFHGRGRLDTFAATGASRVLVADDLVLVAGGAAPGVNDRSRLLLDSEARVLLRGDSPVFTVTATPADGSDVRLGSSIEFTWQADDPVGFTEITETSSQTGTPVTRTFTDGPLQVVNGTDPIVLDIAFEDTPGPVTYTLEGTDVLGARATRVLTWTVLENAAPTGEVTMAGGAPATVKAGYPVAVVVHAEDPEALANVTLLASGPVDVPSQSTSVDGNVQDVPFEVTVPVDATGAEPVVFVAEVTDVHGVVTTTAPLTVTVTPNEVPTGFVSLTAGAPSALQPGESTTVVVHAEDPDGLASLEMATGDPLAFEPALAEVTGTVEDVNVTVTVLGAALPGPASLTAILSDRFGLVFETAQLALTVLEDSVVPLITLDLAPETGDVYTSGDVVDVLVDGTDNVSIATARVFVDGVLAAEGPAPLNYVWTVPPVTAAGPMVITAEVDDPAGNTATTSRTVTVERLDNDVPPEVSFDCPTSGAYLPAGYELTVQLTATDDLGVAFIEVFRNDETEPLTTLRPAVGTEATFTASFIELLPDAVTEQVVRYRAVTSDASALTAVAEIEVHVVPTVDLDPAGANDWTALESQFAVLRSGTLTLSQPRTVGGLIVLPSASLVSGAQSLELTATGAVYVACGGAVDATGSGFGPDTTYPGEVRPGNGTAGSHMGYGGLFSTPLGSTYGSVYQPREPGSGGQHGSVGLPGGGAVRLIASSVVVDGEVLANGLDGTRTDARGGAGGSVWISASGFFGGGGAVEVRGSSVVSGLGSGGGGAIAVEFDTAGGAVFENLRAFGGDTSREGGAGTVYLRGAGAVYGDLVVDTGAVVGEATQLPALGAGVAQAGSGGDVLVTDRPAAVPAYFEGHWVEIYDGTTGAFEAVGRISAITDFTVTLVPEAGEVLAVDPGDLWQGVYQFDDVILGGTLALRGEDPLRIGGTLEVLGDVDLGEVTANHLTVRSGARLTVPLSADPAVPEPLVIHLAGDLLVEDGGAVDLTGRGYGGSRTYPGEVAAGNGTGGSHMGYGGLFSVPLASTYGSLYRPQESGGGGNATNVGTRGGGALRIIAANVTLEGTGALRANGTDGDRTDSRGGAGGSVWISVAGTISGDGTVEARGSNVTSGLGSGGGGAVAVEYGAASGTVLDNVLVHGGQGDRVGGAGTYYRRGPSSSYGDLIVDNGPVDGGTTELPALGSGTAGTGSGGDVLVTGLASIQPFFVGHWVEVTDPATGTLRGTWRIAEIAGATVTLEPSGAMPATVFEGDLWQGVYRFDNFSVRGNFPVESPDPIRVGGTQEIVGDVELREIVADSLILRAGATLTHPPTADPSLPESLRIELTGELVIEPGASIDVTGRGFRRDTTYPGEVRAGNGSGGSHMGYGGLFSAPLGSTYGSVYQPRENGAGGQAGNVGTHGGGTVRILAAAVTLQGATSAIRANGEDSDRNDGRGGAGGSVWISVSGVISGDGVIEARGGNVGDHLGAGGGGAVAVEYGAASGTVLDNVRAHGGVSNQGSTDRVGGAGTFYLYGPSSSYGDLVVDNGPADGGMTELPALGSGTAGAGSGGDVLVTALGSIQPFFVGHWVEVTDPATGTLRGTWRVAAIDGSTLTLEPNGAMPATVFENDLWQGVYRFDNFSVRGNFPVESPDPIRVGGTQEIVGDVELREIVADTLILRSGATLTHPPTSDPSFPESLRIELTGELVIEADASIDVTGRGFRRGTTYPGEVGAGNGSGGSHMGYGGLWDPPLGSTYGSVYRPRENGAGGQTTNVGTHGGGTVRILAAGVTLQDATSAIRANGDDSTRTDGRGGAGGSVWISVSGAISGDGVIEARGGQVAGGLGSGGGGAIAVEYMSTTGTVLENLSSYGGATGRPGGAGTVYLFGPTSVDGDLFVDNAAIAGQETELPALGVGTALIGSGGAVLETDPATPVPEYFAGHWVEVYDGTTGTLEGTWRIAEAAGTTVTLAPNGAETISVDSGDLWQGVYRFDNLTVRGTIPFRSQDPVLVTGTQLLDGDVELRRVTAGDLTLSGTTTLTHPATQDATQPEHLELVVTGELLLQSGAVIDLTGRGFRRHTTYPGESLPGNGSGGSHMGAGGLWDPPLGSTYGSVYRPRENGAGGQTGNVGNHGGGAVRIVAGDVTLEASSVIRANADPSTRTDNRGGAGGSVWISVAGTIGGDGVIEALGTTVIGDLGSGGGGAIAVEYGAATGTVLGNLDARGGSAGREGGAGTVYLFGPSSVYGDLTVDNGEIPGQETILPALGAGVAAAGSGGAVLVTDRAADVPAYFEGHWVEIYDAATGQLEGTWRIAKISGLAATLEPNGVESINVDAGDVWQGVYRFDNLTLRGTIPFESPDPVRVSGTQVVDGSLTLREITAANLTLAADATITHPTTTLNTAPESLTLEIEGNLVLEAGAEIDATGRGFGRDSTYPGETISGSLAGGSHIGRGGTASAAPGSTYGSVYRPRESGAGGNSNVGGRGGGVIRIVAGHLSLAATSAIHANAEAPTRGDWRGGAGGSVWISAESISGDGLIEARGGASGSNNYGSGGGGAVAVEYLTASGTVIDNLLATGGDHFREGGAGTLYLHHAASTYGDVVIDNGALGSALTELPALGGGTAQTGTLGATLVSDRAAAIPVWFEGHWVEVRDGVSGALKGTWRIASVNGVTATLEPEGVEVIELQSGDRWQGVYRFDNLALRGAIRFESLDPVRVTAQEMAGDVEARRITGNDLTLLPSTTLTHATTTDNANPESLLIELTGDLVLQAGASIDVSVRGFGRDSSYPGETISGSLAGGSHLGRGGTASAASGSTYGSVYMPMENGAGGNSNVGGRGGGAVRIVAENLVLEATSSIRANAEPPTRNDWRGAAGGSVWIAVNGSISGDGVIEALGSASSNNDYGSGGGGAIAVEYTTTSGSVLTNLLALGGDHFREGGAGTLYLKAAASTHGDLHVDNGGFAGAETELPALGGGTASAGSGGAVLITERAIDIPAYFVGHWVEVSAPDGTPEGIYRIASVNGVSATFEDDGQTISVDPGDLWQGVYRFDAVTVAGGAVLISTDPVLENGVPLILLTSEPDVQPIE